MAIASPETQAKMQVTTTTSMERARYAVEIQYLDAIVEGNGLVWEALDSTAHIVIDALGICLDQHVIQSTLSERKCC
jgi:hypothetical protein